jgi:hypothetical protein
MAMPAVRRPLGAWSYAWTYVKNAITVLRSRSSGAAPPTEGSANPHARGGERASDRPDLTDQELEPTFTEEAFARVLMDEVQHLYRGRNLPFGEAWNTTLEVLDLLRNDVIESTGQPPIMILYPSQAQIYLEVFETMKQEIKKRVPSVDLTDFDVGFPNKMMLNFCRRAQVICHDITPAVIAAARDSPQPLYRPRDTHWNVRGNAVAAAAEAAFLRSDLCASDRTGGHSSRQQ